ncbi:MAG: hypothetical protein OHK0046_23880 [Anaerolineae bacterium]
MTIQKLWIDPQPVDIPPDLAAAYSPTLAATLVRRGIQTLAQAQRFLESSLYQPAPPDDLPDMDKAVARIEQAVRQGERLCVWGDFDVDGQTATSLLVSALRRLGLEAQYYIPHREQEGHGIAIPRLEGLINDGVQVILTCDTGISAHEAVDFANARGVDVVITDHHQLLPELPRAVAAVNPQRLPEGHPLRTLPGVGCAYKLVEALFTRAGLADELPQFLDLVALGIVADVAELRADTRYLLQRGLDVLKTTERLGLKLMFESAGIDPARLTAEDIGFGFGPRLNALGRLDDANVAVELLTTPELETARILVNRVEALNAQRKLLSNQVFEAAQRQIEADRDLLLKYSVLVLAHETWPGGIIGIVANRLADLYNRPVILFNAPPEGIARGSARSVAGCDITAAIAEHADMLTRYGGHTMAAGLSLPTAQIQAFRSAISRTVRQRLGQVETVPTLAIDAYVSLGDASLDLLDTLQRLAPFGVGNPPLTLATRRVLLRDYRLMGRNDEHARLVVEDEHGKTHDVIWWQADISALPKGRFDLAYTLHANDYQGKREARLQYVDSRPVDEEPQQFAHRTAVEIVDLRTMQEPQSLLDMLEEVVIWAEGEKVAGGQTRETLTHAPTLVIWTAPPGTAELQQALEAVNPAKVVLIGLNPGTDSVQLFLQKFSGVVKHALGTMDGQVRLSTLAAAVAHREVTALAGLGWLAARGHIQYTLEDDQVQLRPGTGETQQSLLSETTARVATLLQETAAYRSYFRRTEADVVVQIHNT